MHAGPPTYMYTYKHRWPQGHMHKFTWSIPLQMHIYTATQPHKHSLKVSTLQPILSLCFYVLCFPLPLSFSHLLSPCTIALPLSYGASVICRQSWEKFRAKCVPLAFQVFSTIAVLTCCLTFSFIFVWLRDFFKSSFNLISPRNNPTELENLVSKIVQAKMT